ncbi:MAG: hypothetical protein KGL37_05315, partial [Acidobacteriota bacterium]|nr:hypothetical protein [Acidobacteriota bacterium]
TRHVEAWLHGEGVHAPELDETQCRIGLWLAEEKNNPRRDFETMRLIEKLHVQAHDRDWRAVRSWQQGQLAAALASAHEGAEIREQMKLELDGLLMARSR